MRITEKNKNGFYELKVDKYIYGEEHGIRLVQVVGRYEDIEEEFGIDLGILADALKKGIIYVPFVYNLDNTLDSVAPFKVIGINQDRIIYEYPNGLYATKLLKDYGKTWALTEEELL